MSSRQLRRLNRQNIEETVPTDSSLDKETYENNTDNQNKFNAFSFLNENIDKESESDEELDKTPAQESDTLSLPSTIRSKKSKKKKNKKKQVVQEEKNDEEDDHEELDKILEQIKAKDLKKSTGPKMSENEQQFELMPDFEDEYNEILDPMATYDSNFKNFTTERLNESLPILSIKTPKNLDSDEELKNLFGNLSLATIEDANANTSLAITPDVLRQFKRLARLTKGWGGKDRKSVPGSNRKLLLTRIRDDYLPTAVKPLQMVELTDREILRYFDYKEDTAEVQELQLKIYKEMKLGVKYFSFKKINDAREKVANSQFYASVVLAPDHDALISLLRNYPYHAETLLQVSMVILRQSGEKSSSNALLERCLFVFDRSFHVVFHDLVESGKNGLVRLPYESFMNRQFYLCIFRYIVMLGERATYFTSFNYCKFLLSLNPAEDPLGVRYFIDFYAIMSDEYEFLIKLVESPLVTCYSKWYTPGIAFSTVLSYINIKDWDNAKRMLKKAHSIHPYTSYKLLKEVCASPNIPITESDLYVNDEMLLSTNTYMVRAKVLWNDTTKIQFLTDELIKYFTEDKLNQQKSQTASGFTSIVKNYFVQNKKSTNNKLDNEIPYNLLRFAIISGENSLMAKVPQAIWERDDVYEFDPLPPKSNTLGYDAMTGVNTDFKIIDTSLDYVDQNVLATLIQHRTQDDPIDEIIRQIQAQADQ